MYLFTLFVDSESEAIQMMKNCNLEKNKIEVLWQWVKKNETMVIACDFHCRAESRL
jgi:hypothetical protein